jgi:tetratricopeptide (TPR) repeat protein
MSRMALAALGALIAVVAICDRLAVRSSIARGNEALKRDDIQAAAALYQAVLERRPASGAASLGLGVVRYRQHRYEDAVRDFDRAGRLLHAASDRARANYDRGNAYYTLRAIGPGRTTIAEMLISRSASFMGLWKATRRR